MDSIPSEEAVQTTNDDASECKRCAVQLGYWVDPYISLFVRSSERKPPEINRGYFARKHGIEMLVEKFFKLVGSHCQIVNIGAGYDTLYWRLQDAGHTVVKFVDVDYPTVTAKKCHYIKKSKILLDKLSIGDGEVFHNASDMHAGNYHILGVDVRQTAELESRLNQCGVDFSIPTLFIAECVLVYIETCMVDNLMKWIANRFNTAAFINYEQTNMNDRFGEVMKQNLRMRHCSLSGVSACYDLESQKKRFTNNNWDGSHAWDMVEVYANIPGSERYRIEKIEFLDEQELLTQLFQHYCICVGWKGPKLDRINFE